ncbi:hypothetical protein MANAM107_08170 [Actinomyces capricornis]|uniref:Uncharacterized protein n=1 Tax=Actinomyces capricornis TaxID=2755559 RepID=A0ABM7U988_9ACTO|nr:hypothetical protein MANAM107_08170 [Actinomyces capricornis]
MGIEVWAFTALIVILAVYLLPFLVRRREMTGRANVQDRYSAELRVLATGVAAPERDGTCESSGHAELFRRRPKVRAMNRPAVRNVRALRAERELIHVRKTHAQARERRRVAASHRAVVASILLGVALGAWVLGLLTALPWWPALVPTALLGVSMAAGRRAAMVSAAADKRERRRIAELERELMGLTGRRPAVPVVASSRAEGAAHESASAVESASNAESAAGSHGATVSSVRASLPEILQELRAENAEKERARAAERAEAADEAGAARDGAARSAGREDRAQSAERRAAEREEHRRRRSQEERRERAERERAEAAQRADGARTPEPVEAAVPVGAATPVETATSVDSPERAGGGSEFHSAVGSFEAVSPAWSQIVPDGEQDGAIEGASPAERSGPRHSTASSSAASRITASPVASDSTAERRRADSSAGVSRRQAAPASGEGRWSLSAESAESVAARAAIRARTEDEERARSGEEAPSGRSTDEARGSGSGAGSTRKSIKKEALAAFPDKSVVKEPTTSTPPQGWRPIKVPAPTYTLAARAPKRVFADPVVDEGASAPVPARPQAVRTFTAPDFSEQDFHPIDLDAILERRRAAGE